MVRVGIILISMSPGITGICGRPRRPPVLMRNVNPPLGQNRATPILHPQTTLHGMEMYHRPDVPSVCVGSDCRGDFRQACEPRSRIDCRRRVQRVNHNHRGPNHATVSVARCGASARPGGSLQNDDLDHPGDNRPSGASWLHKRMARSGLGTVPECSTSRAIIDKDESSPEDRCQSSRLFKLLRAAAKHRPPSVSQSRRKP